jgi:hypothetical protein
MAVRKTSLQMARQLRLLTEIPRLSLRPLRLAFAFFAVKGLICPQSNKILNREVRKEEPQRTQRRLNSGL